MKIKIDTSRTFQAFYANGSVLFIYLFFINLMIHKKKKQDTTYIAILKTKHFFLYFYIFLFNTQASSCFSVVYCRWFSHRAPSVHLHLRSYYVISNAQNTTVLTLNFFYCFYCFYLLLCTVYAVYAVLCATMLPCHSCLHVCCRNW